LEGDLKMKKLFSVDELYKLYEKYNSLYFDNKLPKPYEVTIEWSNRLSSSAGVCYRRAKIIRLSTAYHIKYPEEVGATLLHEMIHLKIKGHGHDFKRELRRIQSLGGKVYRYSKETAKAPRWKYSCKKCDAVIKKYKRYPKNIICGRCRGEFEEVYIGD
jgi:predicted SprT family Zn-dependent metalloprotease